MTAVSPARSLSVNGAGLRPAGPADGHDPGLAGVLAWGREDGLAGGQARGAEPLHLEAHRDPALRVADLRAESTSIRATT